MITKLYTKTHAFMTSYKNDEQGVTAIEYGLIGVAMAVLLGVVLSSGDNTMLGELQDAFDGISSALSTATDTE
ncbi:Flp family type IVb pilin [Photobacterium nomapromontoriensis]|uniref:Flp family type IVb pilin n=1 Tax=Photobacterium nomapromontoriensis TaxID=2910237 RepID=UPI003D15092F